MNKPIVLPPIAYCRRMTKLANGFITIKEYIPCSCPTCADRGHWKEIYVGTNESDAIKWATDMLIMEEE